MQTHKTANVADIEVTTEVEPLTMGVPNAERMASRTDLNGLRVMLPNRPEIYLIDEGYKRQIPNPQTYNNLFRDWSGIVIDIGIDQIPTGPAIANGAILASGSGTAAVYLIDNGVKRHVTGPGVMDKYNFSWELVYVVPQILVSYLRIGPAIY